MEQLNTLMNKNHQNVILELFWKMTIWQVHVCDYLCCCDLNFNCDISGCLRSLMTILGCFLSWHLYYPKGEVTDFHLLMKEYNSVKALRVIQCWQSLTWYIQGHSSGNQVYIEIFWKLCVTRIMLSVEENLSSPLWSRLGKSILTQKEQM